MNCQPQHLVTHRANAAYTYCQNCGEITDIYGKVVVPRSRACPERHHHHIYHACAVCGNDERLFPKTKAMNREQLRFFRQAEGLPPESPYMEWLAKRQKLVARINDQELIPEEDYLNAYKHETKTNII